MGKSCLRYKNAEHIPFNLIGELVAKISPDEWIEMYERTFRPAPLKTPSRPKLTKK